MSASLFAITAEYRDAAMKLADMDLDAATIADTLESLSGDLEVKSQAVAHMVRSLEADAAAIKQWAADAQDRAKAAQARADSLRDYLSRCLDACGIEAVKGPGVAISFRKSSAVVVNEPGLIPLEFMRVKPAPEPEPNKTAIAEALKAGAEVPGAHLEHRKILQIK